MTTATFTFRSVLRCTVLVLAVLTITASAQITPSDDAYISSTAPTTNYGAATSIAVQNPAATGLIRFDLSSIPSSFTSANVSKATLKLYVSAATSSGTFNVVRVTSSWSEKTVTYNTAPTLGAAIASGIPVAAANKNKYVEVDITAAVGEWLNGTANDGVALVPGSGASFTINTKETTTTSHPAELDVVFNGPAGPPGPVSSVGLSAPSSDFVVSGSPITSAGTLGLGWNVAPTSAAVANAIVKRDGSGSFSANSVTASSLVSGTVTGTAVNAGALAATDAVFSNSIKVTNSSNSFPIAASSNTPGTAVILGFASSTTGSSWGVEGYTNSSDSAAYGVVGTAGSSTGNPRGVYGRAIGVSGAGVFGQNGSLSGTGTGAAYQGAGVFGDGGTAGLVGVVGTADDNTAGTFYNNSTFIYTLFAGNFGSGPLFHAYNYSTASGCSIDSGGNLNCTGSKNAVVPIDGGKRIVAMSAIESPKNWFEDFGSAQLSSGSAVVTLDSDFIQTVNTEMDYMVIPVPNGECKGLYVTNKTPASFEVRELGGGTSTIHFDYRIVALRKKYENVRFADHTNDPDPRKMMLKRGQKVNPQATQEMRNKPFAPTQTASQNSAFAGRTKVGKPLVPPIANAAPAQH